MTARLFGRLAALLGERLARQEIQALICDRDETRRERDDAQASLKRAEELVSDYRARNIAQGELLLKAISERREAVAALAAATPAELRLKLDLAVEDKLRAEAERNQAIVEREAAEKARAADGEWAAPVMEELGLSGWRRRALRAEATLRKLDVRTDHRHDCDQLAAQLVNHAARTVRNHGEN